MDGYLWLKALHVIAVIAWMAGLLYLPRLFVYHADTQAGSETSETFKVMERRLLKAIMTPAMGVTWLLGLAMVFFHGIGFGDGSFWLHIKLVLVFILSGFHGFLAKEVRIFAADQNERPARFFRIINEIPTVIMIAVVILVIGKPF